MDTKDILLRAGSARFCAQGYHGTGLKDILDDAGVPKGSFYHYFKSKEDFAIQIITRGFRDKHGFLESILLNNAIAPLQRLQDLLDAYEKAGYKNDALLMKMMAEMSNLSPAIRECLENGVNRSKEILAACLEDARAAGEIDRDHHCGDLSEFIFCSWEGALMRSRVSGSNRPFSVFAHYILNHLLSK